MVVPKLPVLIKLFLQDGQEDIPYEVLVLMAAVEKVPLSGH